MQLAYAIGVAEPVSLRVRARGWSKPSVPDAVLRDAVRQVFRLTPYGIIQELELLQPIYRATASGGHFGRSGFPWERTDKAAALKAQVEATRQA